METQRALPFPSLEVYLDCLLRHFRKRRVEKGGFYGIQPEVWRSDKEVSELVGWDDPHEIRGM